MPISATAHRLVRPWLSLAFLVLASFAAQAAELTVSAASSLTNAFRDIGPVFETQNPGTKLLFNFAASDALFAQIARGAPADVFAAADQEAMDRAQVQKLLISGSRRNFVGNTLVLVMPSDSTLNLKLLADLQRSEVKRVAIGNPTSVPAGRYAKGALVAARVWTVVEPKTVFAQNARQVLDYVARGEVEAGLVYATDAAVQKDKVKVVFQVPTEAPISYPIATIAGSPNADAARKFVHFVMSPAGQSVLLKYGFQKP